MFDTKTLTATPGLARRILSFSEMSGLTFDEKLADLAVQDLVDVRPLANKWTLDSQMIETLQFVQDWRGRAMLLESGNERARIVALANAALRGGKTLILAQPLFYAQWAELILAAHPDAKINLFGNPRYEPKDATYPGGLEFETRPDYEADFMITSYGSVIWHDMVEHMDVNQTIVEELDHLGSINYKWNEAVGGLFHEIPAPLFIQNIHNLPNDTGRDNMASLQTSGSKAIQYVGQIVHQLMWNNLAVTRPLVAGTMRDVEGYLGAQQYKNADLLNILHSFGVSSHLLDDQGNKSNLTFFDDTVSQLKAERNIRSSHGLLRFVEREEELERSKGLDIDELVQRALDGSLVTQELIGDLRTHQWANLKAQHLKAVHTNLTNRTSKNLFLVSNADLKRNLRLQFGVMIEDYSAVSDCRYTASRFLYPNNILSGLSLMQLQNIKHLYNLIVDVDDLIREPILLETANFLFVPEWPLDREIYQAIKGAADASGTRMVTSVLNGTFEEIIHTKLL